MIKKLRISIYDVSDDKIVNNLATTYKDRLIKRYSTM